MISKILKKLKTRYYTQKVLRSGARFTSVPKINSYSVIHSNVSGGENCNFNGINITKMGTVKIGNNFHSGRECMIITNFHNYNGDKIPYDNTYIVKDVIIDDNVWLGNRVIILGGVKIGEGAIIQAGAVVVKDIPPYAIAGGNPATVFKYRDIEKYLRLKGEKKFH